VFARSDCGASIWLSARRSGGSLPASLTRSLARAALLTAGPARPEATYDWLEEFPAAASALTGDACGSACGGCEEARAMTSTERAELGAASPLSLRKLDCRTYSACAGSACSRAFDPTSRRVL
jgi:hypothetical protein